MTISTEMPTTFKTWITGSTNEILMLEVSLAHITRANRNTKRLCPHFVWSSYSYIPRQSRCLGLRKGKRMRTYHIPQNHPIKQLPKIKHKDPRKNLTYRPSYSLTSKTKTHLPYQAGGFTPTSLLRCHFPSASTSTHHSPCRSCRVPPKRARGCVFASGFFLLLTCKGAVTGTSDCACQQTRTNTKKHTRTQIQNMPYSPLAFTGLGAPISFSGLN